MLLLAGRGAVWQARSTGGAEVAGSSPVAPIFRALPEKWSRGEVSLFLEEFSEFLVEPVEGILDRFGEGLVQFE